MFKNIVVAVDGSAHADSAIDIACDLAKHYDGRIHLVHAPEIEGFGLAVGSGAFLKQAELDAVQNAGQDTMDRAVDRVRDMGLTPASHVIGPGHAADEAIALAVAKGADLIVAGRRGLGNIGGLLLGSVSQKIAHQAPCACLTVK